MTPTTAPTTAPPAAPRTSSSTRRRVLTTAAWSVPAVAMATAAPAYAASPCQQTYAGTVRFATTGGVAPNYTRASTTSGSASVALTGAPASVTPVGVTFSSALAATPAGTSLNAANFTVVDGRFALNQVTQNSTASGVGGQTLTVSFARPVRNLTFAIGGFTRANTYNDTAFLTLPAGLTFTTGTQGADVSGAGTSTTPWTTNRVNASDGAVTTANTVPAVTIAGPVSTFSLRYYSTIAQTGTQPQALYLSNLTFAASC